MAHEAYPLYWPVHRMRTPSNKRSQPKFETGSFAAERDFLLAELKRGGASGVVLSTNLTMRLDGLPDSGQRQPDDTGVAAYLNRTGKPLALCCDLRVKVEQNISALAACRALVDAHNLDTVEDARMLACEALAKAGAA